MNPRPQDAVQGMGRQRNAKSVSASLSFIARNVPAACLAAFNTTSPIFGWKKGSFSLGTHVPEVPVGRRRAEVELTQPPMANPPERQVLAVTVPTDTLAPRGGRWVVWAARLRGKNPTLVPGRWILNGCREGAERESH